jgi:hypothetical protein
MEQVPDAKAKRLKSSNYIYQLATLAAALLLLLTVI